MPTFTTKLGADEVAIVAPATGTFDRAAFSAAFPSGALYGLDVEGTYMGDRGQFAEDFEVRLVQFATSTYAWVLDLADQEQHQAAVQLLADPDISFCSHTNMDVLAVFTRLGVDITGRNVDTRLLSRMVKPDDTSGHDLKNLATEYLGPQLAELDARMYELFLRLWVEAGGRRNVAEAKVKEYGWSAVEATNELYLTYAGLDAIACRRLVEVLVPLTGASPELLRMETWLAGQAIRIQARGLRVDQVELDALRAHAETEATEVGTEVARITGGLSNLSPKVKDWLTDHGVDWSAWPGAHTPTGQPSLEKDNILHLRSYPLDADGAAVVEQLIRFRGVHDILNKTKGIRDAVDANGRLHPTLHTIGTVTGRMSSTKPNFQNFSKKNPRMRGLFIPEPGHILVTADFDQIELRVVAALAREQKMIDTILAGGDLHQLTADEIGIPRDLAKVVNFLIVYGGGGQALHEQGGIELGRAKEIVAAFRERYPAINRLSQQLSEEDQAVRNIAMRRIPVTVNRKTGELRRFANINYVVQSSARELLVHAWYRFAVEFGHGDLVWFPIHDELVLQVPEAELETVMRDVETCMSFDFMGVPISAGAVPLIDPDGRSRWMTSKSAEKYAQEREPAHAA